MKNKFMRSVTAMVVAVTMLISSQGVVTSFADGGDYSDRSESSSVQMNEVGNNGTDQSTKDDAAQCNCEATDGEAHKESCPLYVKPDGGNTDGGNTEDDAAQCTCGAKEGEPHQENCPLYVKPDGGNTDNGNTNDGDTDNGAGEDTNIKSVVDAINALPAAETITEETDLVSLKDQVNAARVAYDALSDDQKAAFDAATLEKLTALEAKISELESGNQETESSEAVQNVIEKIDAAVEQIDYTTETITATDGTTVTKTHITMLKDLDPANNAELKALIDKEAAHEQDENQPALTDEEAAKLSDARKVFEDAKAKYLSEGFSNAQLAARQAYDALATEEEKAQVTNYSLLEAMEENIAYIMQAVNTLPNGETVAMIGDTEYKTLDEAIAAAGDGATIEVLQDCTTQNGFSIFGKSLTIDGNNHAITVDNLGIYLLNNGSNIAELTFKNCKQLNISPVSGTPTAAGNSAPWASVIVSFDCILTFDNCTVNIQQPSGETTVTTGFYYHEGSKIDLNNTKMYVQNFKSNAFSADVKDNGQPYSSELNILSASNLNISNNYAGVTAAMKVTITNSSFTSSNRGNASNGADYFITDSKVAISGNGGHGMSARNVEIVNSNVTCEGNGGFGVTYYGSMKMDGSSTLNANQNGNAGLRANNKGKTSDVASGAKVNILGNSHNGLENYGDFTFEDGVILRINNNDEVSTNGGGIYNAGSIILPSDTEIMNNHAKQTGGGICNDGTVTVPNGVKLYNNHADLAGDDIHLGSEDRFNNASITFYPVGSDWTLTQTQLPITGWYFDGHKDGTSTKLNTNRWSQGNYYDLANVTADGITLRGFQSLKAAHAYAYDPETPVNPTDWEHSKSKTATNLDANYQSQVTLSLPSSEYQLASDVVFVLDKSTSGNVKDDAIKMLESLKSDIEENGAKVNVGIVIFNQAASRFGWYDLITEYDQIIEIFNKEIKDGTNLNAGLLAAKEMLEEHTDVDPNRKHMILVSDGISYYYCEGTNYQQGYTIASLNGGDDGEGTRNCTPDSTLSAWGIKYGTYGADNEGFSYIPDWSQWESGMPALLSSDYTKYQYQVGSPDIPTEADSPKAVPFKERKNYPINVDISLYNSLKLYRDLASKYHCYAVLDGTTNKYTFGTPFMEYMAGETFVGSSSQEKFLNIKNDIFYLVDRESSIVDVIGEGIDNTGNEYDFKFINDINNLNLTVNGISLPKKQIDENTYGFGDAGDGIYDFVLTYYPEGMGTRSMEVAGELFRWDINVPVSNFAPVQLTYTVQLTNPQTADGTYGQYDADGSEEYAGLYTNKMAILYPVDSNGVEGEQEAFQKPTVSYSISNGKPVDPPVDPEDPTPRPGGGGDEDDDTPTIINETPVPTTTIDDEDVPLTDLPEDTVTIDDEEVPLKDIPNTGDMIPVPAMVAAVISIGGIALLMKKHK